jgi:hypothetical protein
MKRVNGLSNEHCYELQVILDDFSSYGEIIHQSVLSDSYLAYYGLRNEECREFRSLCQKKDKKKSSPIDK